MKTILYLAAITMMFMSCNPSIQQLKEIDFVKELNQSTLQVPLTNAEEDIALLRKYGQDKKADRLEKKTAKQNEKIRQAFSEKYSFSTVEFVTEDKLNPSSPWVRIDEQMVANNKRNQERTVLQIIVDGEVKTEFADDMNPSSLSTLVSQFNTRLEKMSREKTS